jgi:hypothetical protein
LVVVVLAGLLLFNLVTVADPESYLRIVLYNGAPYGLLLIVWIVVVAGIMPYQLARRQVAQQSELREPTTYTFTTDGIVGAGHRLSWRIDWGLVKRVRETNSSFIFYRGKQIAMVLPKRFFRSEADIETWRRLVAESLAPKEIESPGVIARWF